MSPNKKVVFLGSTDTDVLSGFSKLREYSQKADWQVVMVATEYGAQKVCQEHGISFKTTLDYLTSERHYRVFTESLRLAKEWYRLPEISEALNHRGISLGEEMEYSIRQLFSGFLLDIELYQGILEIEKPDKIVMIERPPPNVKTHYLTNEDIYDNFIIDSLADSKGIAVERIAPVGKSEPKTQKGGIFGRYIRRALNVLKQIVHYLSMALFLGRRLEIGLYFRLLRNYFFCSSKSSRPTKIFSRKRKRIAFYGLRSAEKIADYLSKDKDNGVINLAGPGQKQRLMSIVPSMYMESFATSQINSTVKQKKREFDSILQRTGSVEYLEKNFHYHGLNFWPIARIKLEYILGEYFPLMVRGMELMKAIVDETGLNILIATSDQNPVIRAIAKVLQKEGGKFLFIQHGLDYFGPEASEVYGKVLLPLVADKTATWGEASRDWYVSHGAPSEKLEVTSCSDFDDYPEILNYPRDSIRRYLGIPRGVKVVLYNLGHGNRDSKVVYVGETRDELLQRVKDVTAEIAKFPQLYLMVRPHPGDRYPEEIEHIVQSMDCTNIVFNPNLPLPYLLRVADVVVTFVSSSALEALMFNDDVIVYNQTGRPESVPYCDDGAALKVTRKEDIVPEILRVLGKDEESTLLGERRKEFVKRAAGPIDGSATRNIASLIIRMIGEA